MPRNVRNFWLTAHVDGKATPIAFGPQGADGGFTLMIEQRDDGDVTGVVGIVGRVVDGRVVLTVAPSPAGEKLMESFPPAPKGFRVETRRDRK